MQFWSPIFTRLWNWSFLSYSCSAWCNKKQNENMHHHMYILYGIMHITSLWSVLRSFFSSLLSVTETRYDLYIFLGIYFQWDKHPRSVVEAFVLLLSPYAPHMAEELWSRLGHTKSLAYEPFPKVWIWVHITPFLFFHGLSSYVFTDFQFIL